MRRRAWLIGAFVAFLGSVFGQGFGCQGEIGVPPGASPQTGGPAEPGSGGGFPSNTGGFPNVAGGNPGTSTGGSPSTGSAGSGTSGAGGSPSSGTSGGSATCASGLTQCGTDCANLGTDSLHCGLCTNACGAGQACQAGVCQCETGFTKCGAACTNLTSDAANCGMCGKACAAGQVCSNSACATSCGTGLTKCGLSCSNTMTDPLNCGTCLTVCPAGTSCSAGRCTCPGTQTVCNNQCVDTSTSATNCGACGTTCPAGRSCVGGSCGCAAGQMLCGTTCTNTQTDAANCGTCGTACAVGGTCAAGKCNNPVVNCTTDNTVFNGHITFYSLVTSGTNIDVACHFPTNMLPANYGAMNTADYNAAAVCGACVEITNSQNGSKLTIPIVDECPAATNMQWCFNGSHHIDLSTSAYGALGANNNPAITWRYVPCTPTGAIQYFIDPGSNQFYLAVTILNTRYRVAKVEVMNGGSFQAMTRQTYNAWVLSSGAGSGPFTFRVTDIYNHVLQDTAVPFTANKPLNGAAQFAACP